MIILPSADHSLQSAEQGSPILLRLGIPLLVFCLCATLGWYLLFSNFRTYDDEGILLMASKLFLGGAGFYTDIKWIYGPGQLATIRWLHDWLSIPLSHSALRYITLGYWFLLCGVGSVLVFRLTRSLWWAIAGLSALFLFTTSIVNEPGHPQSLIAALTVSIPVLAYRQRTGPGTLGWFWVGAILATIFYIKINAGIFCLAAVGTALLPRLVSSRWHSLVRIVLVGLSAAFPFVLMFPLLAQPECLPFAALASAGCSALAFSTSAPYRADHNSVSSWYGLPVGFVVVSIAALTFAALNGAYPGDIHESLLSYAASHSDFYHYFRSYTYYQLGSAALSLTLALVYSLAPGRALGRQITIWGKRYLVLAASFALFTDSPATSQGMIGYAAPWAWLLAVGSSRSLSRDFLSALATWSVLLAYPIPGSQIYFGSCAVLLAAIVCAADLFNAKSLEPGASLFRQKSVDFVGIGLVGLAVFALSLELVRARAQFLQFERLDLPGTGSLAIEPQRARTYRKLIAQLQPGDTVFTTFRSNSVYFWSDTAMPGTLHHAHDIAFATTEEQRQVMDDLSQAAQPVVISRNPPGWGGTPKDSPLLAWIDQYFEVHKKIGPYSVLKPIEWPAEKAKQ